jgi:hypothetical protein
MIGATRHSGDALSVPPVFNMGNTYVAYRWFILNSRGTLMLLNFPRVFTFCEQTVNIKRQPRKAYQLILLLTLLKYCRTHLIFS